MSLWLAALPEIIMQRISLAAALLVADRPRADEDANKAELEQFEGRGSSSPPKPMTRC